MWNENVITLSLSSQTVVRERTHSGSGSSRSSSQRACSRRLNYSILCLSHNVSSSIWSAQIWCEFRVIRGNWRRLFSLTRLDHCTLHIVPDETCHSLVPFVRREKQTDGRTDWEREIALRVSVYVQVQQVSRRANESTRVFKFYMSPRHFICHWTYCSTNFLSLVLNFYYDSSP